MTRGVAKVNKCRVDRDTFAIWGRLGFGIISGVKQREFGITDVAFYVRRWPPLLFRP